MPIEHAALLYVLHQDPKSRLGIPNYIGPCKFVFFVLIAVGGSKWQLLKQCCALCHVSSLIAMIMIAIAMSIQ